MPGKLLFVLLAAGLSVGVHAQEADVPREEQSSSEIVVQGINPDRQISDFVQALTDAPIGGQLSRFAWAVCPAAMGLTQAQNDAIRERMRRVARAASVPLGAEGCKPNVLLIATPDKKALIEGLHEKYPAYFSGIPGRRVRNLANASAPAAAWHVEGRLSADAELLPTDPVSGTQVYEASRDPSRISASTRPHFLGAVVVVEHKALTGLTITQLADYAAMRAFAQTDPDRLEKATAPSILTILEAPMGTPTPLTLTRWDLSFLKALYAMPPAKYVNHQRTAIRSRVRKELERGQEGRGE